MNNESALNIANDFIIKMNKNGELDTRIVTYSTDYIENELDIQYQTDDKTGEVDTVCSLMDKESGDTLDICSLLWN